MIMCALLVSNSRGWCVATPGEHEGTPDYNMMPLFFPQQPIFCSLKAISSLNWEQPQSPLPCHHVISVANIGVASTPGRENARASFCGRLGVWKRIAPDRRHLLPVAATKLIMRCVWKLNFRCTLPFPMKMASSTQLWFIRASAGRYAFSMGSPAWRRFGLCSSGSSLVSRWRDAPLVHARISNVTSQM